MSAKLSKKGRNPGMVDNWLDELGFYRKNVAYDETCFFRAVSEQIFHCQIFHEKVRKQCIEYGRKNYLKFSDLMESEQAWDNHLDMLEKHMVVCGNIEIHIISKMFERDVMLFHAQQQNVYNVTKQNIANLPLMLCLMDDDHYDAVYRKEHISNTGFCQSIVYKILYQEVFKIPNIDDIVGGMLYEKAPVINQLELEERKIPKEEEKRLEEGGIVIAPFPFKVAKALDPTIYRNIEYDSWGEVRRELRLGDWYYGDDKLKLGTRCILQDDMLDESFDCYIQEITKDKNKCVVYLTKLAEKRLVNYSDLSPENDAKPWPLPYRFSKNVIIAEQAVPQLPPMDKVRSMRKKNKEKRQTKNSNNSVENANPYLGVPLQMQSPGKVEVATDTTGLSVPSPDRIVSPVTPEVNNYPQRYQWEPVHWSNAAYLTPEVPYYPATPESFISSHNVFNFDVKPVTSSAAVTSNAIPCHDPNYPYCLNYFADSHNSFLQNEPVLLNDEVLSKQQQPHDRYITALGPQTPQPVEIYSPMVLPSGAIVYTPLPSDIEVMPSSPLLYTPPIDVQYIAPPNYVYTPPQSAQWYHTPPPSAFPCNSSGFIFPQPQN
ncbi:putative bifunctional UDP-N-acetylglucosamine transferase and deubiquitinase ALG13 isoform X2 [Cylas formicarius]|nr:putative bifunctional UDP-N-acetylglucosamine transferase and deubiquitinase ALG13 isoform X2 [Cylas formicarius]XP_060525118.1 putative bifunctional UDP-N-acetylglucosamine transferase and deubiquitinase ALG13 isoform X2 [Cylas formicarius]